MILPQKVQQLRWRVIQRQAIAGFVGSILLALVAPGLVGLDPSPRLGILLRGTLASACGFILATAWTWVTLGRHAATIEDIARGSLAILPHRVAAVAGLPSRLARQFFLVSTLMSMIVALPPMQADGTGNLRAWSMALLGITVFGVVSIPHYLLARLEILRLFEGAPPRLLSQALGDAYLRRRAQGRMSRRMVYGAAVALAFSGIAATLVIHTYLVRASDAFSQGTAVTVAQLSLGDSGSPTTRAEERLRRAQRGAERAMLGSFEAVLRNDDHTEGTWSTMTRSDGALVTTVFGQSPHGLSIALPPRPDGPFVLLGLLLSCAAALLGGLFAWSSAYRLQRDLRDAGRRMQELADPVRAAAGQPPLLSGQSATSLHSRFASAQELMESLDAVTQRFQEFAKARRAMLSHQESARRVRGQLFASVSHDLKSPLNAILGFAELLRRGELSDGQRESLVMVRSRGHELLSLVETILDVARLEAGQMRLQPERMDVRLLVERAVEQTKTLLHLDDAPITLLAPAAGQVDGPDGAIVAVDAIVANVDIGYFSRALAVVLAQAVRTSDDGSLSPVVVAVHQSKRSRRIRFDVQWGHGGVEVSELERLFERKSTARNRSVPLGLSLAKSVVELHGGGVRLGANKQGYPIVRFSIPGADGSLENIPAGPPSNAVLVSDALAD